jgi:hypothetical protein
MRSIKKWFAGVILAGIVMVGCKKKNEEQQLWYNKVDPTIQSFKTALLSGADENAVRRGIYLGAFYTGFISGLPLVEGIRSEHQELVSLFSQAGISYNEDWYRIANWSGELLPFVLTSALILIAFSLSRLMAVRLAAVAASLVIVGTWAHNRAKIAASTVEQDTIMRELESQDNPLASAAAATNTSLYEYEYLLAQKEIVNGKSHEEAYRLAEEQVAEIKKKAREAYRQAYWREFATEGAVALGIQILTLIALIVIRGIFLS